MSNCSTEYLPEITKIRRWRYKPGDRLIVSFAEREIDNADAEMVRERLRATLQLPDDAPIAILVGGIEVMIVEDGASKP